MSDQHHPNRLVKALNDIDPRDRLPLVMFFGFAVVVLFVLVPIAAISTWLG